MPVCSAAPDAASCLSARRAPPIRTKCMPIRKDYPATLNVLETGQSLLIQVDDLKADKAEVAFMREQEVFTNLVIPLKTKSRVWGLLEIYEDVESRVYSKREIRLAESLASRAAVALENAQLHEDAQNKNFKKIHPYLCIL